MHSKMNVLGVLSVTLWLYGWLTIMAASLCQAFANTKTEENAGLGSELEIDN